MHHTKLLVQFHEPLDERGGIYVVLSRENCPLLDNYVML